MLDLIFVISRTIDCKEIFSSNKVHEIIADPITFGHVVV